MGQQQLLLLVLGIVIVGLAVVVGIQAFSENQQKSEIDTRTSELVDIATKIQAWSLKPTTLDGGGGSFNGVTFNDVGYGDGGSDYYTPTGRYLIISSSDSEALLWAHQRDVQPDDDGSRWVYLRICGTEADDIKTAADPSRGAFNPGAAPACTL